MKSRLAATVGLVLTLAWGRQLPGAPGSPQDVVIEVVETITVTDAPRVVPPAIIEVTEEVAVADVPDVVSQPATLVVNSTDDADDGTCDADHCSFREAIDAANVSPARDRIHFGISGTGPHTIQPTAQLPAITDPVVIDGYTQPGASPNTNGPEEGTNAVLMIELDGSVLSEIAGLRPGLRLHTEESMVRGLVINGFVGSGSSAHGIAVAFGDRNKVQGNFIGTDVTGSEARPNHIGVLVSANAEETVVGTDGDGVNDMAERNLISGNNTGVHLQQGAVTHVTGRNIVAGNLIGTDATGTTAVPNKGGVGIVSGTNANRIGTDGDGVADVAERNIISGNQSQGVTIRQAAHGATPERNVVAGNYIGTDVTGTEPLGNGGVGVLIRRSPHNVVDGNVIANNGVAAVHIAWPEATGNRVLNNRIGTDATGAVPMGNRTGVQLVRGARDNAVGGPASATTAAEAGANLIAFNENEGVLIEEGAGNAVLHNRIFDNGALGIELGGDGVSANDAGDADDGANGLQNFPVLTNVELLTTAGLPSPSAVTITGSLESAPNRAFTLQFFRVSMCDPSVHGEGDVLLGQASVTTDGAGTGSFSESFSKSVPFTSFLTATATDPDGNTSEFSRCRSAAFTVVRLGDQEIQDSPLPDGGTLVSAAPTGGRTSAELEACGVTTFEMTAGDEVELACGSATLVVLQGPVEIQLDDNTEAVVPSDATVTVEETEDGGLQLENESGEGSEPIQLVVDGTVVGEVGSGGTLALGTLTVTLAEVQAAEHENEETTRDLEIDGTFSAGAASDGTDVAAEAVTVTFGTFVETIPAGSFVTDEETNGFKYKYEVGADAGITEMKIAPDGGVQIEAVNLDLEEVDLTAPVGVALRIGDDLGSTAIGFDEDGEFAATAAEAAVDLQVTPDTVTVAPGEPAVFTVRLGGRGIFAGRTVSLACEGMPSEAACAFDPETLTPSADGAVSKLTVTTSARVPAREVVPGGSGRSMPPAPPLWAAGLLTLGLVVLALSHGLIVRRRGRVVLAVALTLAASVLYSACGDDVVSPEAHRSTPPGTHTFRVIATADSESRAAEVRLEVAEPGRDGPVGVRGTRR